MGTTTTVVTITVHPDDIDHAMYMVGETLTQGGTAYTIQEKQEEQMANAAGPLAAFAHRQAQVIFALESPPTTSQIREIASETLTGLIYGVIVEGEIDLGKTIISNLGGLGTHRRKKGVQRLRALTGTGTTAELSQPRSQKELDPRVRAAIAKVLKVEEEQVTASATLEKLGWTDLSAGLALVYIQIELQETFSVEISLEEMEQLPGDGRGFCVMSDFQQLLEHKGVL